MPCSSCCADWPYRQCPSTHTYLPIFKPTSHLSVGPVSLPLIRTHHRGKFRTAESQSLHGQRPGSPIRRSLGRIQGPPAQGLHRRTEVWGICPQCRWTGYPVRHQYTPQIGNTRGRQHHSMRLSSVSNTIQVKDASQYYTRYAPASAPELTCHAAPSHVACTPCAIRATSYAGPPRIT